MKVCIMITADVDTEGVSAYKFEYPAFAGETPAQLLVREAIAAWDIEGLLVDHAEPTWTEMPMPREENI